MTKLTRAMSPASLVISILALAVATSMTSAVAATTATEKRLASSSVTSSALRNNAVTTKKIRNNAVTSKKIRKGAVTASKIKKGAVTASKIKNGAVTNAKIKNGTIDIAKLSPKTRAALQGARGPKGDRGPAGPQGPQGPQGLQGAAGVSGYEIVSSSWLEIEPNKRYTFALECPAGKKAISGGAYIENGPWTAPTIYQSFPRADGSGWSVSVRNDAASSVNMIATAVCIIAN